MSAPKKTLNVNAAAFVPPGSSSQPSTPVANPSPSSPNPSSGQPQGNPARSYVAPNRHSDPSGGYSNNSNYQGNSGFPHHATHNSGGHNSHHSFNNSNNNSGGYGGGGTFNNNMGGNYNGPRNNNNMHHHHHHHHNNSGSNTPNFGGGGHHPHGGGGGGNMHHHHGGSGGGNMPHHNQHNHPSPHSHGNFNNPHQPNQHHFGGGGPHHHHNQPHHHQHHHHHHPAVDQFVPKPVFLILGTPRSGKSRVAQVLASDMGFKLVEAPSLGEGEDSPTNANGELKDKYEHLVEVLESNKKDRNVKGFVLDGYGADSEADIYYVCSTLNAQKFRLDFVAYLDMPISEIPKRQGGAEPDTAQMFSHTVAYETCSKNFSESPSFRQAAVLNENGGSRATKEIAQEIRAAYAEVVRPNDLSVTESKTENWTLVNRYDEFRSLRDRLYSTLGITDKTRFLARSVGPILDYTKFVRYHKQFVGCDMTVITNGSRSIVFKVDGQIFYIPEHCYSIYRMNERDISASPFPNIKPHKPGEIACVLEVELVAAPVPDEQNAKREHMIIRDVLYWQGKRGAKMPWAQRKEIIMGLSMPEAEFVLVHKVVHVSDIETLFETWRAVENIAIGIRFEHNGPYKCVETDPRIFTWTDTKSPLLSFRLWNARDDVDKKTGKAVWRFSLFVIDDQSGVETKLDDKAEVVVGDDEVAEAQLNDGQVVDCTPEFISVPPQGKGGKPQPKHVAAAAQQQIWKFNRRRSDLAFPMYKSTVEEMVQAVNNGWDRKNLARACQAIPVPQAKKE